MFRENGVQYQNTKMVLDVTLPNTQHYETRIKCKVQGNGVGPLLHRGVVATEKGAFLSPSTKVLHLSLHNLHILFSCMLLFVL